MYVNIVIYSNKLLLLLFVWSTLKKEKEKKCNNVVYELLSTQKICLYQKSHLFE